MPIYMDTIDYWKTTRPLFSIFPVDQRHILSLHSDPYFVKAFT